MRFLLIYIILGTFVFANAQDTLFYNKKGHPIDKGDEPKLFSLATQHVVKGEGLVRVPKYYLSGQLHSVGFYKGERAIRPIGVFTYYHENGQMAYQGRYNDKGLKIGKWQRWYPNGQLNQETKHVVGEGRKKAFEVLNFYDSLGEHKVIDGNGWYQGFNDGWWLELEGEVKEGQKEGVWKGYRKGGKLFYQEEYLNGKLIKGVSYDKSGDEYRYTTLEEPAEPKKGYDHFYRQVARVMNYPDEARKSGIQGKVYVQFVVNKNGLLYDIEVVKGLSPVLDDEAILAVSKSKPWLPAIRRGQKVKQGMILPITFKL